MIEALATIGVYGTTETTFFDAVTRFGTTAFVDTRRRRGLRGAEYAYANAARLEASLRERGIGYVHRLDLAPSESSRAIEKARDAAGGVAKRQRVGLSSEFIAGFEAECLREFDADAFAAGFPPGSRVVLFCVEQDPGACHRSLIADHLAQRLGIPWRDLTPGG